MKKKTKSGILVLILLLALGFAAVSTNLIINGTAMFGTNTDDFDVIFTKSIIDGVDVSSTTISEDGKTLEFTTSDLAIMNDTSILNFEVTNNSTQYDAKVTMECVAEGEHANTYYKVESDLPEVISAASQENGNVTVTLLKTSVNEIEETFTCTISATAQERTEVGKPKLEWFYTDLDKDGEISKGDLYALGNEKFNVISHTEDTVTMLAQFNLGTDYKQTETENRVTFSDTNGWEYTPGPKEIDIQNYDGNAKVYVNEYISYLQGETKDNSITGNLITLSELKTIGCTINDDYTYTDGLTCANSSNASWLLNGQSWWTRSATPAYVTGVWFVASGGTLNFSSFYKDRGVRPVITISKSALNNL